MSDHAAPRSSPNPTSPSRADSVQRVIDAAADAGLEIDVIEYPDGTKTAEAAAAAVSCLVDQIVKSMVFDADGEIVLALTSGSRRVDGDALAALAGASRCGRADADRVRAVTGFAIGGVAPFGHRSSVRTWIDPHLLDYDQVWAAAGTPRHVFAIEPPRLVTLTGAVLGDFAVGAPT